MNGFHILWADRFDTIPRDVIDLLEGKQPRQHQSPLGSSVRATALGLPALLLILQASWFLVLVSRYRKGAAKTGQPGGGTLWQLTPLLISVLVALLIVGALHQAGNAPLLVTLNYAPDFTLLMILNALIALLIGLISSQLRYRSRKSTGS